MYLKILKNGKDTNLRIVVPEINTCENARTKQVLRDAFMKVASVLCLELPMEVTTSHGLALVEIIRRTDTIEGVNFYELVPEFPGSS